MNFGNLFLVCVFFVISFSAFLWMICSFKKMISWASCSLLYITCDMHVCICTPPCGHHVGVNQESPSSTSPCRENGCMYLGEILSTDRLSEVLQRFQMEANRIYSNMVHKIHTPLTIGNMAMCLKCPSLSKSCRVSVRKQEFDQNTLT